MEFDIVSNNGSAIFSFPDLFLKNYSYNLLYNNPDFFLNFGKMTSLSLIPILPFFILIPFLGGLFYLMKFKLDKINIISIISGVFLNST